MGNSCKFEATDFATSGKASLREFTFPVGEKAHFDVFPNRNWSNWACGKSCKFLITSYLRHGMNFSSARYGACTNCTAWEVV